MSKDKNGQSVPHLEITKVILVHCNIFDNDYRQNPEVLYTFVPNKLFDNLYELSSPNFIYLKTFKS